MNDGGNDSMCYWSENHQILFSTSEFLAGQLLPDHTFTQTGITDKQHMEQAEKKF